MSRAKVLEMLEAFNKFYNVSDHPQKRFKIRAFQNAISAVKKIPEVPKTKKELMAISGIGKGIAERIIELQETGKVKEWDKIKKDPKLEALNTLSSILGIGSALATKLFDQGIKSISDLKKAISSKKVELSSGQMIGLNYYKQLARRIPRKEISDFRKVLVRILKKVDDNSKLTIAGSYRRGNETCGDVDILIYDPDIKTEAQAKKKKSLKEFVDKLFETGIAIEKVSLGPTKFMGLFAWPPNSNHVLKADIRFVPQVSYLSALVYFTGSRDNNLVMRRKAQQLGYKLNEYGLFGTDAKRITFNSERDLYKELGLKYKGPRSR